MPKFPDPNRNSGAFGGASIVHKPGMADELMREIAPLLAAEGIDLNRPNMFSMETANEALARAIERRNFELFVATGPRLSSARAVLRIFAEAISDENKELAESVIWSVEPEPADPATASVGHVIGVSAGAVDLWHGDPKLAGMLSRIVVPRWRSRARAAAADVLALAKKGRAFDSIAALHGRHSGLAIVEGAALAVAGTLIAISKSQGRDLREVTVELLS